MLTMLVQFILHNASLKILSQLNFHDPHNQTLLYNSHKHISPQLGANHHGNNLAKIVSQVSEEIPRST